MRVALALEIDTEQDHLAPVVANLGESLQSFFADKSYGDGVENLLIGVILTGPGSERLHPIRPFKYQKLLKTKIPGRVVERRNIVQYDVKPSYVLFSQLSLEQARKQLAQLLVDSVDLVEYHKSEYPDFDVSQFRGDMKMCLGTDSA